MGARPPGGPRGRRMSHEQRVRAERWLAWVRLGAVPFAIFQSLVAGPYSDGARACGSGRRPAVLGGGGDPLFVLAREGSEPAGARAARSGRARLRLRGRLVVHPRAARSSRATPIRQVLILVLIEAAFRYGIRGRLVARRGERPGAHRLRVAARRPLPRALPLRERHAPDRGRGDDRADRRLARASGCGPRPRSPTTRASEAEQLRDELGRRAHDLSTRRTAAPARSARRSRWTRPSARSSGAARR